PNLELFGGLSGMATGAIRLLKASGLSERNAWGLICLVTLAALVTKTGFEIATGQMAFAQSNSIMLKAVPISHLAGALAAAGVWWFADKQHLTLTFARS